MKNCIVTVASNMSDETYEMLCEKANRRYGGDLVFTKVTDDGIIGGFILDMDGMICDASIATQIDEMGKHLKGV